ncbi:pseudouridine synthase [Halomonas binhaiensis]|uniref:tRNA pseudouridine synthase C n=1 Tax=Halomonas binhaiensis TaxID=2562282 RepID=A0A5C1NKL1_9GAMM|nr:pseudouridine synthase [Halomonas binhaiensis]QEM83221.1 pseudouridylate synthase [Halomonas binhaiensis]
MPLSLPILFQDDHLVAVHKPSGLLVHRSPLAGAESDFLVQRLRDQLGQKVYPVHRLDRPTSGVIVFALSSEVAARLNTAFSERLVEKRYLAVVRGIGPEEQCIERPLREEDGSRPKAEMPALDATTVVRRLDSVELPVQVDRYPQARYSLMVANPLTGRRHQIRRHLAGIGYPIIGDAKHGKGNHNRFFREALDCPRLLLAAVGLRFQHPMTGHRLVLDCPLDDTMTRLFDRFGWNAHLPRPAAIETMIS